MGPPCRRPLHQQPQLIDAASHALNPPTHSRRGPGTHSPPLKGISVSPQNAGAHCSAGSPNTIQDGSTIVACPFPMPTRLPGSRRDAALAVTQSHQSPVLAVTFDHEDGPPKTCGFRSRRMSIQLNWSDLNRRAFFGSTVSAQLHLPGICARCPIAVASSCNHPVVHQPG